MYIIYIHVYIYIYIYIYIYNIYIYTYIIYIYIHIYIIYIYICLGQEKTRKGQEKEVQSDGCKVAQPKRVWLGHSAFGK